jgi:glycosyltransferase involved in cell wall biosynthesis
MSVLESLMKLSIIIPVYNEKNTVIPLVGHVRSVPFDKEILIVDDGSTDGTGELLKTLRSNDVRIFVHEHNQGKGAAICTAQSHVTGDIVIIQDADMEYDPIQYVQLLQPILDGHADAVFGSRFLGGPHRVLFFWHMIANRLLTLISNMLTNLNLSDMETGYKVVRAPLFKSIPLRSNRFGFEPEITAKLAKRGARIYEVPISYHGRDYKEGKKITWRDGPAAIYFILKFNIFCRDLRTPTPQCSCRREQ